MHHAVLLDSLCKLETKPKPALAATLIVNTVLTAEVFYGIGADTNREVALFCEEIQQKEIDMRFKARYLLIAVARSKHAASAVLPRGPEQAPAPWSPPSAACTPRIIELSRGVLKETYRALLQVQSKLSARVKEVWGDHASNRTLSHLHLHGCRYTFAIGIKT
jgi:hypothetical protein